MAEEETRCVNDTDGDGDCAACARNPQALCRVPFAPGEVVASSTLSFTDLMDVLDLVAVEPYRSTYLDAPSDEDRVPPDYVMEHKLDGESRTEAKKRLYLDQMTEYMTIWGPPGAIKRRLSDDVLDAGSLATYRDVSEYALRPREYMQGLRGGGRPYDTRNWGHFSTRYGMDRPERRRAIWLGVLKTTVETMMIEAAKETDARITNRILGI